MYVAGAHGLDPDGQVDGLRHHNLGPLRSRPSQRRISRVDHEVSLPTNDRAGNRTACHRWTAVLDVGIFVRTVRGLHATWLVNSAAHMWGSRRFSTRDMSTNNWFVALLTFGEGWHNNHHAHPSSSRHGLKWYEVDMNWYGTWALKMLGLAKQIKAVKLPESAQEAISTNYDDYLTVEDCLTRNPSAI
jgi:hypothetical protein